VPEIVPDAEERSQLCAVLDFRLQKLRLDGDRGHRKQQLRRCKQSSNRGWLFRLRDIIDISYCSEHQVQAEFDEHEQDEEGEEVSNNYFGFNVHITKLTKIYNNMIDFIFVI
jgi:hypothetical protein